MRQALYRKYRPRTFDEVVGQDAVTTILRREMESGTLSHAYLFVGSRGTGKTTCAKLVAKAANCEHPVNGNPCNECAICRGIDDGSLLDVVEIDAASNNGVDSIRELRDNVVYTPTVAKYRVYIIDEVHMLSTSAFNALLKTLEEPPEHVIFVLATTEINKVLPTIISRCQRFDFQRIESDVIAGRLATVAEREGFALAPDAAQLIGRMADGGMRDALSMLDVCVANSENVTAEVVANALGLAGSAHLFEMTNRILNGDTAGVLTLVTELSQKGLEVQRLCEQLVGHFRDLMLAKTVEHPEKLVSCLPGDIPALREQGAKIPLGDLLENITVLQDAGVRMSRTTSKRAELELALVELTEPSVKSGTAAILQRIERLEHAIENGQFSVSTAPVSPASASAPANPPVSTAKIQAPSPAQPEEVKKPPAGTAQPDNADSVTGSAQLFRPWPQVLEALSISNSAVAGMMTGTKAYFDGRHVLIDMQNPILLEMLRTNDYTRNSIKQAIRDVTGQSYPIGPYRPPEKQKEKIDPLESLISSLPASEQINIH